jgi:hypothetical protein
VVAARRNSVEYSRLSILLHGNHYGRAMRHLNVLLPATIVPFARRGGNSHSRSRGVEGYILSGTVLLHVFEVCVDLVHRLSKPSSGHLCYPPRGRQGAIAASRGI